MSRVVAITGICSDTAQAAAREFAREGDALALLSRTPGDVEAATRAMRAYGARTVGIVVDTTDADSVESAVHRIEDELGPVDVWVNTADEVPEVAFDDLCPAQLREVTERCYLGHVHTTMSALERMQERDSGTIIHVAGDLATRGRAGRAAHSGAEAALRGFHEALVEELHDEGSEVRLVLVRHPEGTSAETTGRAILDAAAAPRRSTQGV